MTRTPIRHAFLGFLCCWTFSCGGGSAPPAAPSAAPTPVPWRPTGLRLDAGFPSARFTVDWGGGGPGVIDYSLCYSIRAEEDSYEHTMRIEKVEYWVIGRDGSVYDNKVHGSLEGRKLGGISSTVGIGCARTELQERDLDRPIAETYRVRLEYTFDSGSPAGVQVLTAERPITSTVPRQPLLTGVTMTTPADGQHPSFRIPLPARFTAAARGGRPPYQYEWRHGNNIVLREWSTDSSFVWDGSYTLSGSVFRPTNSSVTVLARSADGTVAEAMAIKSVFLAN